MCVLTTHVYTRVTRVHIYVHGWMCRSIDVQVCVNEFVNESSASMYVYIIMIYRYYYIYIHVRMCMRTRTYTRARAHACMHIYIDAASHTRACMHFTCVHTYAYDSP